MPVLGEAKMKTARIPVVLLGAMLVAFGLSACSEDADGSADAGADVGADTTDDTENDGGVDGDAAAPVASGLPCVIEELLDANCRGCHGPDPQFGAPMSLVTRDDLLAPAPTDDSMTVYEMMQVRVSSDIAPMPPPPNEPLSPAELTALDDWIAAGTPGNEDICDDLPGPSAPIGSPYDWPTEDECDHLVQLRAFDDEDSKFEVPLRNDHYECFEFEIPWGEEVHGLGFRPVIDDTRVVHHWLLYADDQEGRDGRHYRCSGAHPNSELLAGWAPGGTEIVMPPNVGLKMPAPGSRFVLEIHYNNTAGHTDAADSSGVEICATSRLRENTAGMHWLGSEGIAMFSGGETNVVGTCSPQSDEPIHILQSWPHMHQLGTRMKSFIIRADDTRETLVDKPFSFESQVSYWTPATIMPGDRIRTVCTYNNTTGGLVTFGSGTDDEMCYNFVMAWPIGALTNGESLTSTGNVCLQ